MYTHAPAPNRVIKINMATTIRIIFITGLPDEGFGAAAMGAATTGAAGKGLGGAAAGTFPATAGIAGTGAEGPP